MRKTLTVLVVALLGGLLAWLLFSGPEEAGPAPDVDSTEIVGGPTAAEIDAPLSRADARTVPVAAPFDNRMVKVGSGSHDLSGLVVDEQGEPVPNAWVAAYSVPFPLLDFEFSIEEIFDRPLDFDLEPLASVFANEEGRFSLAGIPGRTLYVTARTYQRLTPRRQRVVPDSLDGEDGVILRTVAAASLSGKVVDPSGQPVANAEVLLGPGVKYIVSAFRNRRFFLERIYTGPDGSFEVEAVPAGASLTAMAFRTGTLQSGVVEFGPLPRSSAGKSTVELEEMGGLSGTIADTEDEPVGGAMVVAVPIDLRRVIPFIRDVGAWTTTSNSRGSYQFPDLPRGLYLMLAQGPEGRSAPRTARVSSEKSLASPLVVDRKVAMEGRVIDADGEPIVNALVKLQSIPTGGDSGNRSERDMMNQAGGMILEAAKEIIPELLPDATFARTNGKGEFRLAAWTTARVRVEAPGYVTSDFNFRRLDEDKKPVLQLFQPGGIEGLVMDAGARKPVPFYLVRGELRQSGSGQIVAELDAVESGARGPGQGIAIGGGGVVADPPDEDGGSQEAVQADWQKSPDEQLLAPDPSWRAQLAGAVLVDDPKGRFQMANLPPGKWRLTIQAEGYENGVQNDVFVKSGEVTKGVVFSLKRGATVSGRVVQSGNENPVGGAVVSIGEGEESSFLLMLQGLGDGVAMGETSSDGTFTISGAPEGSDRVNVIADGFAVSSVEMPPLEAFEERTGIEVQLSSGGTLTGTVSDRNGVPLPGRMVGALSIQARDLQQTATNDEGVYRMENMRPGSYFMLTADLDDEALFTGDFMTMLSSSRLTTAHVTEGRENVVNIVDESAGGCKLTGQVVDKGMPVAGANMVAMAAESTGLLDLRMSTARTDEDGFFEFKSLAPGEYRFQIETGEWDGGIEMTVHDIPEDYRVIEIPQAVVRGRVVALQTGAPVPGASVILSSTAEPTGIAAMFGGGGDREWERTEEDGTFEFTGISPGRYKIEVRPDDDDEDGSPTLGRTETDSFEVMANGVVDVDLVRLPIGGKIVVNAFGPDGESYGRWFSLRAVPEDGREEDEQSMRGWGREGKGTINGLEEGMYEVRAESRGTAPVVLYGIRVTAGQTTELNVTLAEGVTLRARITDANGQGLSPSSLELVDSEGRVVNEQDGIPAAFRRMFGSPDGVTEIGTFPAGSYTLRVQHDGLTQEVPVSLVAGNDQVVDVRF